MKNNYLRINGISLIVVQSTKKDLFTLHSTLITSLFSWIIKEIIQHKMPPYPEGFLNHLTADEVCI